MKTCPQCRNVYDEDYVFCLTDGNALLDGDGEQETVLNQKFSMPRLEIASEANSFCPSCGLGNKANSKFCKKCGTSFVDDPGVLSPQSGFAQFGGGVATDPPYNETVAFQSPTFTPPQTQTERPVSNKNARIVAFIASGVVLVIIVYGLSSLGSGKPAVNTNKIPTPTPDDKIKLLKSFDRQYQGTISGQKTTKSLLMSLKRELGTLTGTATTSTTDTLSGTIEENGEFRLYARPSGTTYDTGIFSGQIHDDGSITGQWTDLDGRNGRDFRLQQQP